VTAQAELRYGFGKNWAEFVDRHFDAARLRESIDHMLSFLRLRSLEGRTFLDVGCGSGLHSLAALEAGAKRVVSFDYDADSVNTTRLLRERAGSPAHWTVAQGSVLDAEHMRRLEPADVVYSWGVLHHTGQMWKAVENAALPLAPGGVYYISLYTTDVFIRPTPQYWLRVKQRYNRARPFRRRLMEWSYACRHTVVPALMQGVNPWPILAGRQQGRGMSYWTDVKDWLGGWPMEFAGIAETKRFGAGLGLELVNISAGEATTEYLFRHPGVGYWDVLLAARVMRPLDGPFEHHRGHAYACRLAGPPERSPLMLYEDGVPVGFPHQRPHHIASRGGGRYLHANGELLFSSTDGSDPNTSGHRYSVCTEIAHHPPTA
jgi:SAM-dependent methyltransferase